MLLCMREYVRCLVARRASVPTPRYPPSPSPMHVHLRAMQIKPLVLRFTRPDISLRPTNEFTSAMLVIQEALGRFRREVHIPAIQYNRL
jgi:hypothetical protein